MTKACFGIGLPNRPQSETTGATSDTAILWNHLEDAAVVFLGGRKFVMQDSAAFINGMKSRLVVMLNSEDAATTFRQVEQNVTEQFDISN